MREISFSASFSRPRLKYSSPSKFGTALAYELESATSRPLRRKVGYPLENGKTEPTIFWNLPCMALPPGGVAVQVGFRRLVDCCHSTLYSGHEHRHLAPLASPPFSPHFESGFFSFFFFLFSFFFHHLIAGLQKGPFSPMFPKVSSSPWACFPLVFFHHHITSELVL